MDVLGTLGKWAALEHRVNALESKVGQNQTKLLDLLSELMQRVIALEQERRYIDEKIQHTVSDAKLAASAAATMAVANLSNSNLERIIKLEMAVGGEPIRPAALPPPPVAQPQEP